MSSTFTQTHRMLQVHTPLGKDVLLLSDFSGTEAISELFEFELEMWSENHGIAAADIVGKNITFEVALPEGGSRHFNGFVSHFSAGPRRDELRMYRAVVVPWLWFLTRTSDCKIFQNKTVPDILEEVFAEYGFSDYKLSGITGNHPELEYCVQFIRMKPVDF